MLSGTGKEGCGTLCEYSGEEVLFVRILHEINGVAVCGALILEKGGEVVDSMTIIWMCLFFVCFVGMFFWTHRVNDYLATTFLRPFSLSSSAREDSLAEMSKKLKSTDCRYTLVD